MAIDTRADRQRAHRSADAWARVLPQPDGTVDAADRAHAAGFYIAADPGGVTYLGPALENIAVADGRNWHINL